MTENIILAVVLLAILGGAITYIVKAKKRGQKCIGCPYSNSCGKSAGCSCGEGK
ncbi:MAG: FeoB-associated Cys-rich membrane protein [Clostridia bacterium]|nr:FeoB-associated Cys-rich membrane protein [Clostridia bacterium]MBQ2254181.1 FeoB-associated Cys-rich membrane protein [Clostridia bacterium]MBQ5791404.1 FeoB-associated Cys-rich membrane protein [Clostridia bacterium]